MALFLTHVNTVLGKLRETPITALSTDATTEAYRAQEAVRRAVARVWNAKQWSFKIRSYYFNTTSGVEAYPMFQTVGEPFSILSDEHPYNIKVISESFFDEKVPNPTETGVPRFCRLFEMTGSWTQPSSASVVQVVSSNAADTTQKVLVKGLINDQYIDMEEMSLAGTATVSGSKLFTSILAITKSDSTTGYVTVSASSATLAVMSPADTVVRNRIMRFYPEPDSAYQITIKHFGLAPQLTHAYEDTEIPQRWDYVVDQFAFALALQSKGQEQAAEFQTAFNVATKMLEHDMATEEYIASEEIIIPQRWGSNIGELNPWASLPTGYNYPSSY